MNYIKYFLIMLTLFVQTVSAQSLENPKITYFHNDITGTPINEGDYVISRDELTGEISAKQITHKFVEQHDDDVRELTVSNGLVKTVIITSDEHPFYVFSRGFTAASELKTNDQLVSLDYQILKVVSNKRIEQSMPMYNFEVADYHTYAVSEQNVWVHNDCGWTPGKQLWSKGKLKSHFEKHGAEFGAKNSKEYNDMALAFAQKENDGSFIDMTKGAFSYRYEKSTGTIFIGSTKGGKIKSFYKWDGRDNDHVINSLKDAGKL